MTPAKGEKKTMGIPESQVLKKKESRIMSISVRRVFELIP